MTLKSGKIHQKKGTIKMISVNRLELVAALTEVKRVKVPKNTGVPILKNVYLYIKDDYLHLVNSDGENSIDYKIKVINNHGSFKAAVNLIELDKIVRKFKSDILVLSIEGNDLEVNDSRTSIKLENSVAAYPMLPNTPKELLFELNRDQFINLFKNGLYAISKQQSRPILNGFNLISDGKILEVNSTDSYRLAHTQIEFNGIKDLNITIKSNFIDMILKSKLKDDIKVYKDDYLIMLQAGPVVYYSKLMEGNYPAIDRLIPSEFSTHLIIDDLKSVIDALELAKITLDKEARAYITIELIDGKSVITTLKNDFKHDIKGSYELDDLLISANPDYLIDALKQLDPKKPVSVKFVSSVRPFTLSQENDGTVHLLTPIRAR